MPARLFNHILPSQRIRTFLILFALALTLPLVSLAIFALNQMASLEEEEIERRVLQVAQALAADIDRELDRATIALETLATSVALARGDFAAFHEQASRALMRDKAGILLVDRTFQQLLNTRAAYGSALPQTSDRETAQRVFDTKQRQVSDLFMGVVSRQPVINVEVPVFEGEDVRYVLIMTLDATRFEQVLQSQRLEPQWITGITDNKGIILARSERHADFVGTPLPKELLEQSRTAKGVFRATSVAGQEVLRGDRPIPNNRLAGIGDCAGGTSRGVAQARAVVCCGDDCHSVSARSFPCVHIRHLYGAPPQGGHDRCYGSWAWTTCRAAPITTGGGEYNHSCTKRRIIGAQAPPRTFHIPDAGACPPRQEPACSREGDGVADRAPDRDRWPIRAAIRSAHPRAGGIARPLGAAELGRRMARATLSELTWTYFGFGPRAQIEGPALFLNANAVQNLGFAFHELATNASKHGALTSSQGRVLVTWRGPEADGLIRLEWVERDGPPVQYPKHQGFGFVVITELVAQALQGVAKLDFSPDGVRWHLEIPGSHALTTPHTTAEAST